MKWQKVWLTILILVMLLVSLGACGSQTPKVVEKVVEKAVTQVVTQTVKETVIVKGEAQTVEKEVTRVVEQVVTATPEPAAAGEKKTFIFADGTEPASLYVPLHTGPPATLNYLLYDPLVGHNADFEPDPNRGLATSWEVAEDNVTWTFSLRKGVKFHDGTDFDANAVKVTLDTLLDPDTGALRRASFTVIKEVNVVDPYTVEIVTDGMFPDLPFLLMDRSTFIISPTAMEEMGFEEFGLHPVGTGPFKFVEWLPNDRIVFEANPDYWQGRPRADEVIYRRVSEDSVRTAMLKTGEVDMVLNIPPEDLDALRADPKIEVVQRNSLTTVGCEHKQTQPPFDSREVRLAMQLAVDTQAIIDGIMNSAGSRVTSPAPVGIWGAVEFEPYPYDPARAKELLAEAGYPDGFEGNLRYVPGRWAGDEAVTQALQAYWLAIGANIKLNKMEMAELVELGARDPDLMPGWTSQQYRSSAYLDYHLYRLFSCKANDHTQRGYCNPEVDRLIEQGRSTFDLDERYSYYEEAQKVIWEDVPFTWVFVQQKLIGTQTDVAGYEILSTGDLRLFNVIN